MVLGKVAAPTAACFTFWPQVYEQALTNNITAFITQPGYFWSDGVMAMLNERNRTACWLRIESEDRDPARLLLSLVASARRIFPTAGARTVEAMRSSPGPVAGWEPLFALLGQELLDLLPGNCVLVLENIHNLVRSSQPVNYLLNDFLPWVSRRFNCLLTSQDLLSLAGLPETILEQSVDDLRLDLQMAKRLFNEKRCPISSNCLQTAMANSDGRAVALASLCAAGELMDPGYLERAILETKSIEQLFTRIAQSIINNSQPEANLALAVANHLTYSHPNLDAASSGEDTSLVGPWFQPLSDDWMRVYQIWKKSLNMVLRVQEDRLQTAMLNSADYLLSQGAIDWAIRIYFKCGEVGSAARAVADVADKYMDMGLWESLDNWLKQIPPEAMDEWPRLVYYQGELAAIKGETIKARYAFRNASQLFANCKDIDGYCQSKLAESALAARLNDHDQAWSSALVASRLAAQYELNRQSDWANWQLGHLAGKADKLDDALAFLGQVTRDEHEPAFDHLFERAAALAQQLQEAKRQREYHRQAYLEQKGMENETSQQLNQLLSGSFDWKEVLVNQSWSQIHPVQKLTALSPEKATAATRQLDIMQRLLEVMKLPWPLRKMIENKGAIIKSKKPPTLPRVQPVLLLPKIRQDKEERKTTEASSITALTSQKDEHVQVHAAKNTPPDKEARLNIMIENNEPESNAADGTIPYLAVHCLGSFQIFQNDQLIENWPLRKSLAIFKYLLVHRHKFVSKEILMETFWPDAEPESARRNLHQAIYTLRQSLHTSTSEYQYIIFINDRYRLNPDLQIWSDVEEFERHYQAGRQYEKEKKIEMAFQEYESAVNLYRGDFMADDLYEEWPVSIRQSLWQEYLTMAYFLVDIYNSYKEYSVAANFCQRILSMDDSQEEAHLNLMKCFQAQGKRNQAVHQYHICRQVLRVKMNLQPSPEMQELYRQITKK